MAGSKSKAGNFLSGGECVCVGVGVGGGLHELAFTTEYE